VRIASASHSAQGFSLLEVLVAMAIAFITASGLIHLFVVSLSLVSDARDETIATLLAMQKVEELRFASGSSGALAPSPVDALETSAAGYSDLIDSRGQPVAGAPGPPSSTVYLRRWAIRPLIGDSVSSTLVQVLVTTPRRQGDGTRGPRRQRDHADALVSIVREVQ
jgi:prepilin-type N-terminal cleavage/methylation domain-containing protein